MKHISYFIRRALRTLVRASEPGNGRRVSTRSVLFSALLLSLYTARIVNDLLL